ncbi:MAG: hypothetical protein Harvfovirus14_9 [Harvfovirus sp.]|uniref:Uncharacterized protein n=1 Tax=Harvfovirus sp. TaxID=2487768 RepID=A0A3G5A1D8_9VIRU|nr:MAG: hypothetical protein Harvfovirus14_9 [Harvfovirus sp.]
MPPSEVRAQVCHSASSADTTLDLAERNVNSNNYQDYKPGKDFWFSISFNDWFQ